MGSNLGSVSGTTLGPAFETIIGSRCMSVHGSTLELTFKIL